MSPVVPSHSLPIFNLGHCVVDLRIGKVIWPDRSESITDNEQKLLMYLARTPGEPQPLAELRQALGYHPSSNSRAVSHAVRRLRLKIELDPAEPVLLVSVYQRGYALHLPAQPESADEGFDDVLALPYHLDGPHPDQSVAIVLAKADAILEVLPDTPTSTAVELSARLLRAASHSTLDLQLERLWDVHGRAEGGERALILAALLAYMWRRGSLDVAIELARAYDAEQPFDGPHARLGHVVFGQVYTSMVWNARGKRDTGWRGVRLARRLGCRREGAMLLERVATAMWRLGDRDRAMQYFEDAEQTFAALGHQRALHRTRHNRAKARFECGMVDGVLTTYTEVADFFRRTGHLRFAAKASLNLALGLISACDPRRAEAITVECIQESVAVGDRRLEQFATSVRGLALCALDRLDEAAAAFRRAEHISEDYYGTIWGVFESRLGKAWLAIHDGRLLDARVELRRALREAGDDADAAQATAAWAWHALTWPEGHAIRRRALAQADRCGVPIELTHEQLFDASANDVRAWSYLRQLSCRLL